MAIKTKKTTTKKIDEKTAAKEHKKISKRDTKTGTGIKAKKKAVRSSARPEPADKTKKTEEKALGLDKYIEAVGRRKTAVARVRLWTKGEKEFLINDKKYQDYFPNFELQKIVLGPLEMMKSEDKFRISVKVKGSGKHSQSEAVRHGLSRALIKFNPEFRKRLKKAGFLTRDPRMRERKKFGLKRARRAPQWSKR